MASQTPSRPQSTALMAVKALDDNGSLSPMPDVAQDDHLASMDTRISTLDDHAVDTDSVNIVAGMPKRGRKTGKKPASLKSSANASATNSAQPSPRPGTGPSGLSNAHTAAHDVVKKLDPVQLEDNEHIISLEVSPRILDQYLDVIHRAQDSHTNLMTKLEPSERDQRVVKRMIVELDDILVHPDVVDRTTLDDHLDGVWGGELTYTRINSQKFALLDGLLRQLRDDLRNKKLHIAVIVRPGRIHELMCRFLFLGNFAFDSFTNDGNESDNQANATDLKVTVYSSDYTGLNLPVVDLIYVMDASYDRTGSLVKELRGVSPDKTHVLLPWFYGSPEHVRACLPATTSRLDALRIYAQAIVQLRPVLGELRKGADKLPDLVPKLVTWIVSGFQAPFPALPMAQIELNGLELIFKESKKRQRDSEDESDSSSSRKSPKKKKVIDSDGQPTAGLSTPASGVTDAPAIPKPPVKTDGQDGSAAASNNNKVDKTLNARYLELQAERDKYLARSQELQSTAMGLMAACDSAISQFQAYERLTARLREENQTLVDAATTIHEQMANNSKRDQEQKAKIKELELTVKAAVFDAPVDGSVNTRGAVVVISAFQQQIQEQEEFIARLNKKIKNQNNHAEYVTAMYQEARDKSTQDTLTVAALRKELALLKSLNPPDDGNGKSAAIWLLETQITGLQSELKEATKEIAALKTQNETLFDYTQNGNGRMSTRGQRGPAGNNSPVPKTRSRNPSVTPDTRRIDLRP